MDAEQAEKWNAEEQQKTHADCTCGWEFSGSEGQMVEAVGKHIRTMHPESPINVNINDREVIHGARVKST